MDPVSELIEALNAKHPASESSGSALDDAAELIPGRGETSVTNLLDSPELKQFRDHYAAGKVEAALIGKVLDILKQFLAARGLI